MSTPEEDKEAYKAKLRSLVFTTARQKYVDTEDYVWMKPGEVKDVRDTPGFYSDTEGSNDAGN